MTVADARNALGSALMNRLTRVNGRFRQRLGRPVDQDAADEFARMCADNGAASPLYRAGDFWREINTYFRDLIWAGGLASLRDQYFVERFSSPKPKSDQVYHHLIALYHRVLEPRDRLGFLTRESEPSEGGASRQVTFSGRKMSLDWLQSIDEAYTILDTWRSSGREGSPRVFAELGAGYGRLAYVLRKMVPDSSYVILDLPEALACSTSWLRRVLPGEVVPYDSSRALPSISRAQLENGRVWTLGAQQMPAISDDAIDVFINIYSFAEMPRRSIDNYFTQLDRITSGTFYSKQRRVEDNVVDKELISDGTYPIRAGWERLYRGDYPLDPQFFEEVHGTRPITREH